MTPEELRALLTPEGLRLLDEVGAVTADADVVRIVSRLRAAGHSPDLVAAVLTQARLRTRARSRFHEFADRMLFTPDGLEQATRLQVAAQHAEIGRASCREDVGASGSGLLDTGT